MNIDTVVVDCGELRLWYGVNHKGVDRVHQMGMEAVDMEFIV